MNKTKDQTSGVLSHDLYWENKMYKPKRSIESRAHPCRKPPRDTLISVERNAIFGNLDNRAFQLCSLNARSLRKKSSAFVDLVCDLIAALFTICESWLNDLDSAILSELTLFQLFGGVAGLRCYIGTVLM